MQIKILSDTCYILLNIFTCSQTQLESSTQQQMLKLFYYCRHVYFLWCHCRTTEVVVQRCSVKKVFLKILQSFLIITLFLIFFFIKRESLAQMFSCEFCEMFKSTFFIEQLCWLLLARAEWRAGGSCSPQKKEIKNESFWVKINHTNFTFI